MIRTYKRGQNHHVDCIMGERRLRGSLGTKDKAVASRLRSRIEMAVVEGSRSENWVELKRVLPSTTYARLAKATGLRIEQTPTWNGLVSIFWTDCSGRVKLCKMAKSTVQRYEYVLARFTDYLGINNDGGTTALSEITPWLVEDFKVWRKGNILAKANSRGGNGLGVEVSVIHSVFNLAVERRMVPKNPVQTDPAKATVEVNPFTGDELARLRGACETDLEKLVYAVFRHTGLRVSDAADLRWGDVQLMDRMVDRLTIKRRKAVQIPIAQELFECLEVLKDQAIDGHVLLRENKSLTAAQLRSILHLISQRANVENSHPHKYRHTLACDLLLKGATPYEVGQILGDTTATVEKHYLKFVSQLRTKVRGMMDDSTIGLEAR